jgi:hypothetical protein
MPVAWDHPLQVAAHPSGIAFWAEEDSAVVVVKTDNLESLPCKKLGYFGSDEAARARYECAFFHETLPLARQDCLEIASGQTFTSLIANLQ